MITRNSDHTNAVGPLTVKQIEQYEQEGFLVAHGLFSSSEIRTVKQFFDAMAERGEQTPHWKPEIDADAPLKRYPRVMHPHRWDPMSKSMMLKPELGSALEQLLGEPAVGCQSMYYFKPPESPGQALHQDNFYLAVAPGTCIAAWTAIDRTDTMNGCMFVVPGSHRMDIHCPDLVELARTQRTNLVEPPKGMKAVPCVMEPGDTLFFNGSVIHGSGRNKSATEWRRSLIFHYMPASSTHINPTYSPIFDFDGNEVKVEASAKGGPCGYGDEIKGLPASYAVDAVIH